MSAKRSFIQILIFLAWQVLSDPVKRRQFDSVDPTFDETIPSISAKGDFFTIYKSLFDNEARFSIKKNVPSLGDMSATKQEVQSFYDFWFRFESWRSFEAFDEEKTDSADSREEKRYLERINKTARAKRKKEDNQRINKLVG
jgi:DnaJ family protein C protein 2